MAIEMKELIRNNLDTIIIVGFYLVEIPVIALSLWEAFTGKSIIDVIWKDKGSGEHERQQGSESSV